MNLFETVKTTVSVTQTAAHYGLNANRNDMICCPFHEDHHPSMKLNERYFYCFGCGERGDVIDLVAKLFNLSGYEAAQKIAIDFGIDLDKLPASTLPKPSYPLARSFQQEELYCRQVLSEYLRLLNTWKLNEPKTPDEAIDDRFKEACQMLDRVEELIDILTFATLEVRVELVDMLQKDGTIQRLEKRLRREVDSSEEQEKEYTDLV